MLGNAEADVNNQMSRKYKEEKIRSYLKRRREDEEDSDVDFEASRRSTREQSKSTIRSALFLAKH